MTEQAFRCEVTEVALPTVTVRHVLAWYDGRQMAISCRFRTASGTARIAHLRVVDGRREFDVRLDHFDQLELRFNEEDVSPLPLGVEAWLEVYAFLVEMLCRLCTASGIVLPEALAELAHSPAA